MATRMPMRHPSPQRTDQINQRSQSEQAVRQSRVDDAEGGGRYRRSHCETDPVRETGVRRAVTQMTSVSGTETDGVDANAGVTGRQTQFGQFSGQRSRSCSRTGVVSHAA